MKTENEIFEEFKILLFEKSGYNSNNITDKNIKNSFWYKKYLLDTRCEELKAAIKNIFKALIYKIFR